MNSVSISKQILHSLVCSLMLILIPACGGGIEGTSDGNPALPLPTDSISDSSMTDTTGSPETDSNNDQSPDGEGTVANSAQSDAAPNTSTLIPADLLDRLNRVQSNSIVTPFNQALAPVAQALEQISNSVISEQAIGQLLPDSVYFNYIYETNTNDSTQTIKWSTDYSHVSVLSSNDDHVIQVLVSDGSITFRHTDIANNRIYQFKSDNTASGARYIEADLNTNGTQSYLVASIDEDKTIAFVSHPTSTNFARQREITNASGEQTDFQTCSQPTCENDSTWVSAVGTDTNAANLIYTDTQNRVQTNDSQSPYGVPDNINEAVLANTLNELPAQLEIQCGFQRLINPEPRVQYFCLSPLPLETTGMPFSEVLSGGQVFYERID